MKDQEVKIETSYHVVSQKGWNTKSMRSTPLTKAQAQQVHNQQVEQGFAHSIIVRVAKLKA